MCLSLPADKDWCVFVSQVFDKDNDGFLTCGELKDVMTTLGEEMKEDEVREMISEADKNGEGKIDYEGKWL